MSNLQVPFNRLERLMARLDFCWGYTQSKLKSINEQGLWMERFRPEGPHGLWIAGHLAYTESGALQLYRELENNRLADWKDLFGKDSTCSDDPSEYPSTATVWKEFEQIRGDIRETFASFTDENLDRPVTYERFRIRDLQSHLEFMLWHDSHHSAQLGAIVNNAAGKQPEQ